MYKTCKNNHDINPSSMEKPFVEEAMIVVKEKMDWGSMIGLEE